MSIFKATSFHGNPLSSLRDKICYIIDPAKAPYAGIRARMGDKRMRDWILCSDAIFVNKRIHGKTAGKAFDHFILRFNDQKDANLSYKAIVSIELNLLYLFCTWNHHSYFGIAAVHIDSAVPHIHFLIDTIDIRTGQRRRIERDEFINLRTILSKYLTHLNVTPLVQFITNETDAIDAT